MEFKKEILQKAARKGSKKVIESFSLFSGSRVDVNVSKVETVSLQKSLSLIKPDDGEAVAVYSQMLSGVSGASFLIISREDALALVDLLNKQEVGTTGILKDIDRSAIKETLNILSNSYITALSDSAGIVLGLGVPRMITSKKLKSIITSLMKKNANNHDMAIIFETELIVTKHKIKASLYFMFNKRLVELIKK